MSELLRFDYVSDLHIDYWDDEYWPDKKDGRKHFPVSWKKIESKSDILVVAGDVSDKLELSLKYLGKLREFYPIVLFIDGNHEHTYRYPDLIPTSSIHPPKGVHYLRKEDYVVGRSVFIGTCGWWDYGRYQNPKKVEETIKNQKGYNRSLGKKRHKWLAENTILQSKKDYQYLIDKLEKYSKLPEIDEIIIVTHTVPKLEFTREASTDYNSYFERISDQLLQEYGVTRWIFGHNHQSFQLEVGRLPALSSRTPKSVQEATHLHSHPLRHPRPLRYLSNPRGRPEDWGREVYSIETTGTVPVSEACKL